MILDCNDIGMKKSEFVAKTQFLSLRLFFKEKDEVLKGSMTP